MQTTLTRENDDGTEYEVVVEFTISKYFPAVMYLSNGDPGYPEEGGEVEVTSAIRQDTLEGVDLTDDEIESLHEVWRDVWGEQEDGDEPDNDPDDYEPRDDRDYDEHEPSDFMEEGYDL